MKSWGCPWFPFVLELFRESAAKSPSPLAKGEYRGVSNGPAAWHAPASPRSPRWRRSPAWGVGRGAWSDKASGHGCPRWLRSQLLARAALWRQIVARRRQPRVTAMGQSDPLTRTQHGQGSVRRQRFGVDPPGLGRVGDECSFLAWGLRHQDPICRPIRVLVARARSESSTTGPRR
jgi:hypothetical protein